MRLLNKKIRDFGGKKSLLYLYCSVFPISGKILIRFCFNTLITTHFEGAVRRLKLKSLLFQISSS